MAYGSPPEEIAATAAGLLKELTERYKSCVKGSQHSHAALFRNYLESSGEYFSRLAELPEGPDSATMPLARMRRIVRSAEDISGRDLEGAIREYFATVQGPRPFTRGHERRLRPLALLMTMLQSCQEVQERHKLPEAASTRR